MLYLLLQYIYYYLLLVKQRRRRTTRSKSTDDKDWKNQTYAYAYEGFPNFPKFWEKQGCKIFSFPECKKDQYERSDPSSWHNAGGRPYWIGLWLLRLPRNKGEASAPVNAKDLEEAIAQKHN